MKKIMSFALAIMLIATMSVTAFAAEDTSPKTIDKDGNSASIPVTGTYKSSGATTETISVEVSWGEMEFTYTAASNGTWNTENHTYGAGTAAKWEAKGNEITIKNHSDVAVNAKFDFNAENGLELTYKFTKDNAEVTTDGIDLVSANSSEYQTKVGEEYPAPTAKVKFEITGGAIDKDYATLGNITVTIAKKSAE